MFLSISLLVGFHTLDGWKVESIKVSHVGTLTSQAAQITYFRSWNRLGLLEGMNRQVFVREFDHLPSPGWLVIDAWTCEPGSCHGCLLLKVGTLCLISLYLYWTILVKLEDPILYLVPMDEVLHALRLLLFALFDLNLLSHGILLLYFRCFHTTLSD